MCAIPTLVLWLVMFHGHRFPVMFTIPPVHRLTFASLSFPITPLIIVILTSPALAVMIANLLMMFASL